MKDDSVGIVQMELCLHYSGPTRNALPSSYSLRFANGVVREADIFLCRNGDRTRPHIPDSATKDSAPHPQYRGIHVDNQISKKNPIRETTLHHHHLTI